MKTDAIPWSKIFHNLMFVSDTKWLEYILVYETAYFYQDIPTQNQQPLIFSNLERLNLFWTSEQNVAWKILFK